MDKRVPENRKLLSHRYLLKTFHCIVDIQIVFKSKWKSHSCTCKSVKWREVKGYNCDKNNYIVRTFWSLLAIVHFLKLLLSPLKWEQYEKYKVIYSRTKTWNIGNTKSLSEWKQFCSDLCVWWSHNMGWEEQTSCWRRTKILIHDATRKVLKRV